MIAYKLVLVACTASLVATVAVAADVSRAASNSATVPALSVAQIIDRNVAAKGGLRAWQQIRSMSMTGKLDAGKTRTAGRLTTTTQDPVMAKAQAKAEVRRAVFGGAAQDTAKEIQLPFLMELTRPLKSRLEIPFQGDTAVQVYDGTAGWKLRPFLGRHQVEPFSAAELKAASEQQALDGPLVDYAAKGTQVTLEGSELVEGRNAYKLRLVLKNGDVRHLWIDAQTFLDVKIDAAPHRVDGRLRTVVTYLRDYRSVNGLQIAHQLETAVDGLPGTQKIIIDRVALNPVLDPARFSKPI